jgi:hypothetical protein
MFTALFKIRENAMKLAAFTRFVTEILPGWYKYFSYLGVASDFG